MQNFRPSQYQVELPLEKLILADQPETADTVPFDVLFVGAGPAGLAGAIRLAQMAKADPSIGELQIGVLDKAASLGGHNLSGAVVNPVAFRELFPELKDSDFPFRVPIEKENVYVLTSSLTLPIPTPPTMYNHGYYAASICEVVRWLGQKAEELGITILPSFPADSLLVEGKKVVGVRTTPAGLDRQSNPGGQYLPPTDIRARVTVLSEGTRGTLSQAYLHWQKIVSPSPQIFALGVKELWKSPHPPKGVIHTLGWPLSMDAFGGSFMYPMGEDLVSFGLVVGLDYKNSKLDVHYLLQKLKQHPLFKQHLDGGQIQEWGAKTIPEGGLLSWPERFSGDGVITIGDAAGLVNVPALKGIHYAMKSGVLAAETIFAALKSGETSAQELSSYDRALRASYIYRDLDEVRNMRPAFKQGFFAGGFLASMMTLTKGAFPGGQQKFPADAEEEKNVSELDTGKTGLSKVDAVYLSGNKTRDDIPSHLIVGADIPKEVAEMYTHVCPAGVYEMQGDKLVVNAPNCVDCKATDVLGPRWRPREGGAGPDYKLM